MACKCKSRPRIISNVVRSMNESGHCCVDVCANPICDDPNILGINAPLIYDEIGVNLCTTFNLGTDISTTYPTATSARLTVIDATYTYGTGNVLIESLTARPNCYRITLSNITLQFAVTLYDNACRPLATLYPTAVYLPSDTSSATYDEDTNPTSVELEIFAPYGVSYAPAATAGGTPTPVINFNGLMTTNNSVTQGINLFAMAKLLEFSLDDDTVTAGVTLVLQSLYFVGYNVKSAGKIEIPKGSIVNPETSDCMRFVAGDLLNLKIKPLDLSCGCSQEAKQPCDNIGGGCCNFSCPRTVGDDTEVTLT